MCVVLQLMYLPKVEESFFLVKARICCLWVVLSRVNWSNPSLFITTINLIYCQQQNLRLSPRSTLSSHWLLGLKSGSVQQILPICITKAWLRTVNLRACKEPSECFNTILQGKGSSLNPNFPKEPCFQYKGEFTTDSARAESVLTSGQR